MSIAIFTTLLACFHLLSSSYCILYLLTPNPAAYMGYLFFQAYLFILALASHVRSCSPESISHQKSRSTIYRPTCRQKWLAAKSATQVLACLVRKPQTPLLTTTTLTNGCQGLTRPPKPVSEEQAFAALRAALAEGCNCWNGAEFYGTPEHNSLTMLKSYYEKYPEDAEKVVLSLKGGTRPGMKIDGSATYIRESVENCLKMLGGRGRIDMFACARRDPNVPLAETIGTLAELMREGKIGGVALSEVSANTIREASEIVKIVAVEIELSLWSTEPLTNGILQVCAEKDILILA